MSDRKDFQIKKTHSKTLKLAMLSEAESVKFGTCRAMWHSHRKSQKMAIVCAAVSCFCHLCLPDWRKCSYG